MFQVQINFIKQILYLKKLMKKNYMSIALRQIYSSFSQQNIINMYSESSLRIKYNFLAWDVNHQKNCSLLLKTDEN